MTIPDGTPMDEDRRAMREQAARLLEVAKGIHAATDDSVIVWGMTSHGAKVLASHLDAKSVELEVYLSALRVYRETVT